MKGHLGEGKTLVDVPVFRGIKSVRYATSGVGVHKSITVRATTCVFLSMAVIHIQHQ